MRLREARKLLSGKLIFGDADQIAARKLIEQVEAAADEIRACPHCIDNLETYGEVKLHKCTERFRPEIGMDAVLLINGKFLGT